MLSLDKFTTEELSRFSRVSLPTVRTVIDRNASRLEKLAVEPTNRRGGQPIRYRLTEAGRNELTANVDQTRDTLKKASAPFVDLFTALIPLRDSQIPLGLRIADDTLSRLVPQAGSDKEKLELLEIAQREARGALQELAVVEPSIARRIEKGVAERLTKIEKERAAIENSTEEWQFPTWEEYVGVRPHLGIQVLAGVPMKSALTKRVVKDLEGNAEILLSEVMQPAQPAREAFDAVILLVDSGDYKKARTQFDCALKFSAAVERPLAILDKGYDNKFRNYVYGAGIRAYCPDAAGLNPTGMRGLVGSILPTPADATIQIKSPRLTQPRQSPRAFSE